MVAPQGFVSLPGWFSWDNEGCGVATIAVGGAPGLVVLAVDAAAQENRGVYRVGRGLDPTTGISADWTPWRDVPKWTSWANQGAGIAVADVTRSGQPDLVVLRVDAPDGPNVGFYRLGRDLDADGMVTNGWGPWIPIPGWFSWDNQGADVAIGDITGTGKLDLVVFMIDNGPEQNRGLYRIGRDLDSNGVVTNGWSEWRDVGTWFSWDNQGGGVTLADLDGNGGLDLIVLAIDNPPGPQPPPSPAPSGQNQAYYQIASQLTIDGDASGGWSSLHGISNWFSWDNQYGALAVLGTGPGAQLVVLAVDNPPELNDAFYTLLPLRERPEVHGQWRQLDYLSQVLAVHAGLLHTGKVLFAAGSGNNRTRAASPNFGDATKQIWTSVVWDPTAAAGSNFAHPDTITRDNGGPFDFFCGGDTLLPDGRIFSAGGTSVYEDDGGFRGQRETASFDPTTEQWTRRATMRVGRWYPSLITLGNGQILTVSGRDGDEGGLNRLIELYDAPTNTWLPDLPEPTDGFPGMPYYAHLFVLADGRVFFSGGRMDDDNPQPAGILDLQPRPLSFTPIDSLVPPTLRNQSSSVLLPPAQNQQVMIIGGGPEDDRTTATGSTERINLLAATPAYQLAMPMSLPRMHLNAVLLPDRTVLATGGAIQHEEVGVAHIPRLEAEIYHPDTDRWDTAATAAVVRMYHSVALLMPDGTVMTASGNPPPGGDQVRWEEKLNEELKIEIFSPPYLFRGARPVITTAPSNWTYATTVDIQTPNAADVRWAELMRPGVTTHAFDNSQRLVDLPVQAADPTNLTVRSPQTPDLAPPGWYMLFVVNQDGVPSVATWILLS